MVVMLEYEFNITENSKQEMKIFMWNLPMFKSCQLIQIFFKNTIWANIVQAKENIFVNC